MVLTKNPLPQIGELVIGQVSNITPSYIQVKLEDYKGMGTEGHAIGMVHVSELSNRWVKNIHSIISMGQRVVLLTLRVNEEKGYVDLSLRRVNGEQKANKMNEWRYATKVENLLKFFAEQNKITLEEIYAKAIFPLIDKYGDIRTALETIKDEGKTVLDNTPGFNLPQNIKDAFCKLIEENVSIHKISITAEYEIRSFQGNGINIIKDAILSAAKIRRPKGLDLKFYYIGAPIYRCVIEAEDYRTAEKFLEKVTKKIESTILPEGSIEVHRDNLSNEQKGAQI